MSFKTFVHESIANDCSKDKLSHTVCLPLTHKSTHMFTVCKRYLYIFMPLHDVDGCNYIILIPTTNGMYECIHSEILPYSSSFHLVDLGLLACINVFHKDFQEI